MDLECENTQLEIRGRKTNEEKKSTRQIPSAAFFDGRSPNRQTNIIKFNQFCFSNPVSPRGYAKSNNIISHPHVSLLNFLIQHLCQSRPPPPDTKVSKTPAKRHPGTGFNFSQTESEFRVFSSSSKRPRFRMGRIPQPAAANGRNED